MNALKRLAALEKWQAIHAAASLTDDERARRIWDVLTYEPDSPRARRIQELLDVARERQQKADER